MDFDIKRIQVAARWDAEERPLAGVAPGAWWSSVDVHLDDGNLVAVDGQHELEAGEELLPAFLRLAEASDEAILAFARRWGMLGLCHHGLPTFHDKSFDVFNHRTLDDGSTCWFEGRREATSAWRHYASRARGLVALSVRLRSGSGVDDDAAEREYQDAVSRISVVTSVERVGDPDGKRHKLGDLVANEIRRWLDVGRVGLRVQWTGDGFVPVLESDYPFLFGALTGRLFLAVAGHSVALCHHCGGLFQPSRRPAVGSDRTAHHAAAMGSRSATPLATTTVGRPLRRRPAAAPGTGMATSARFPSGGATASQTTRPVHGSVLLKGGFTATS
jgi:hypothetical protein